jgi:hypothetical protein
MADTTSYFGNAVPATYPNGSPIIVNGRPLLIPETYSLQQQIDAAHFQRTIGLDSVVNWFFQHFPPGGSGDPQRQAGWSGGFDARFTDAGNYGYGLSAAAADLSLDSALRMATLVNRTGTGKPLPAVNERAIRQGYNDYIARLFPNVSESAGQAYVNSVRHSDYSNASSLGLEILGNAVAAPGNLFYNLLNSEVGQTDVQRYAKAHWGDLNSPDAQAFMANFQQAFGGYPQHLDLDLLHPLPADGINPSGKDVSLFVGRNGEVLTYARPPAPGGKGALRGIYGLDGGPNGAGSTGMNFFRDGTSQPASVLPHPATPSDPTGGIDVTLPNGAGEHWWYDPTDGFIRRQQDYAYVGGGYDTPSERLGHLPSGASLSPPPEKSPTSDDRFGNQTPSPDGVTMPNADRPAPDATKKPMRYLSGRIAGASGPSPFETGAPAVPFVSANDWLASAPSAPFNDQFVSRVPSPSIVAPPNSDQLVPQSQAGGAARPTPQSVRVLSGRLVMPNSSGAGQGRASTPGISEPPAQSGWPPATRPVPDYPIPPMVYGLPDPSAASGDNMDDWFDRWIKPLMQQ